MNDPDELTTRDHVREAIEQVLPIGLVVTDLDGNPIHVNAAFCAMVGLGEGEVLRARPPLPWWPPEERESIETSLETLRRDSGSASGTLQTLMRHSGARFAAHVQVVPLLSARAGAIGWLTTVQERAVLPTPADAHEADLLYRLTSELGRAPSLEALYEVAADGIRAALGVERTSLLLFDDEGIVRFKSWRGLSDAYRRAVEGHSPWKCDEKSPTPIWVSDVEDDPSFEPYLPTFRAERIRALGFVPLVAGETLLGKFMLYYDRPHRFEARDIAIAQTVAGHIAFAVARKVAEDRLARRASELAAVTDNTTAALLLLDGGGRCVVVNAAAAQVTGYALSVLRERGPALLVEGEGPLARALEERACVRGEDVIVGADGRRIEVAFSVSPILEAGASARFLGTVLELRDIRGEKRAAAWIEGQRRLLEQIAEGVPLTEVLESVAHTIEQHAGLRASIALVERPDGALRRGAAPSLPSSHDAALVIDGPERAALRAGRAIVVADLARDARFEAYREHARRHALAACCSSPVRARDGAIVGVLSVYFDRAREPSQDEQELVSTLSRTVSIAIERHRAEEALRLADRRKDEFLAVLGHELRNPLAPILAAVQLLALRGEGTERERAVIERQVRHLERLVDDLLDVSRITRGKIELRRARIDFVDAVSKALEMTRPAIEQKRHALSVHASAGAHYVEGDPVRLAQVVANLLTNAARYTPPGGSIDVKVEADGGDVILRVRDSGVGIAPELLSTVFDQFVQAQSASRSQGGLGLGLTIVRSLVEMHGGTVRALSDGPGLGTELVVRLPTAAPPSEASSSGSVRESAACTRRRVLVVDDNEDAAEMMAMLLRSVGHDVRVAYDGPSALELVRRVPPDVALVDIGLPVMDGYELARHLRAELASDAVIVAVTGYGQESDRARALAAGFHAHFVKPVTFEQLSGVLGG
jgi:PAS domain S-box-containing protein